MKFRYFYPGDFMDTNTSPEQLFLKAQSNDLSDSDKETLIKEIDFILEGIEKGLKILSKMGTEADPKVLKNKETLLKARQRLSN